MSSEHIIIFDTTLRDGEQSPGATMRLDEKLMIAELLDQMGVDVIEAGFAIASPGDFEAVNEVAKLINNASVCSLARAKKADIEAAAKAINPAKNPRIHTFISTSEVHMKYQINMTEDQVLEAIKESVTLSRNFCDNVEWSGMDASRSNPDFLCRAVETALKAGARTINIPDTVGFTIPQEYHECITMLKERVPGIDEAILSVHCHNDLGLAVANSLAALDAGARQIECTINGLGERAGNTAMEEIVMALKTRADILPYYTNINTTYIARASKLVSAITGFVVQNNKAIVGANAFAHESGIHQDGVLKHAATYEIMTPESIGLNRSILVMGKHSGRHAFRNKLKELGIIANDKAIEDGFVQFKQLADRKKEIYDEDIILLMDRGTKKDLNAMVTLQGLSVRSGIGMDQSAEVTVMFDGIECTALATGDGPIDALFKALKSVIDIDPHLTLYQVHGATEGTDAQADVMVRLVYDNRTFSGNACNTDTLTASIEAYIVAINKIYAFKGQGQNAPTPYPV